MMTTKNLDDNQLFALMKFRKQMADCLEPNQKNDRYLLRWLRARSWNVEAAEKMLRDSLEWRKKWNIDKISEWDPPELLKTHFPCGCCGFDTDGSPIVITVFDGFDVVGLLNCFEKRDVQKRTIQVLEYYMKLGEEHNSNQVNSIIDLEGFTLRPYTWRPAAELIISLIKMYESNYPEILKNCFIVNAPKVFTFAFKIVKPFLNELTLSKIKIYKSDPTVWKKAILHSIPEDQIPQYYGGTLTDPDGNPKLLTKICYGGHVPKQMYKNKKGHDDSQNTEYGVQTTVRKGDKLVLEFPVQLPNCLLKWDFKSDKYDIKFGVYSCNNDNGEENHIIPIKKFDCDKTNEVGFIPCEPNCLCNLIVFKIGINL